MQLNIINQPNETETENDRDLSRRNFLVAAGAFATAIAGSPLLADSPSTRQGRSYEDTIKAHKSLRGYWRCEDDLADVMGKAPAKAVTTANGSAGHSFVAGTADGQAIRLTPEQSVAINKTDHLRGRSATVEFFFKLVEAPQGKAHPVLISQTNGQEVRYIVAVKNDLSGLIYQNAFETVQTSIEPPTDQPIEVGRWYHFAMTGFDLDLRAYLDGYQCSLTGGAFEFTRKGPKKSSMIWGKSKVNGWGSSEIALDEVACYASGLSEADFQNHLKAAGWEERLNTTGERVAKVRSDRDAKRAAKAAKMLSDPVLTAPGKTRVYEGEHLEAINFIVGGIGAGGIQFNGKAQPAIWQIACNHRELKIDSLLAVRAQTEGSQPVVRALQTEANGPFAAMPAVSFEGEYPFAKYRFDEPALPVKVELEVFNPFIPMDLKNCAIPCAIYEVTLTNASSVKVQADLLAAQQNGLGFHEGKNGAAKFGGNVNQIVTEGDATLLHMTRQGNDTADMVLMTQAAAAQGCAAFESKAALHDAFSANGNCEGPDSSPASPGGKTVSGALTVPVELAPGESKTVTFVLTWYFKNGQHGDNKKSRLLEGEGKSRMLTWKHTGQQYTNWYSSARDVANYIRENLGDLSARTRRFHDTLYSSNLPVWLLDRLSSQLAVLRSQTCWWSADGYFGAWEGCNPDKGCCGGNCTHVWHYAQAHARLLPELGRKMREEDYDTLRGDGLLPHRHSNQSPAADGHFGTILNTYREHLCSTDNAWLTSQWPKTKKAMDWGIKHWNPKRDGFLQTMQHNTLDGAMTGCSSWIGGLYLSALEAMARMAEIMDDGDAAGEYRRIRKSGQKLQNERLWNGEYYIQQVGEKRNQDYLDGCHIDQLLGQWWADQVGIDPNLPADRCKTAMQSLLKYNFLTDFQGHSLKPRQYCESTDGGMKMITWPKNPQPIPGMKYGDEVMTGFEYGAAVTLIQNGLLKEGLMVIKIISDRYNGRLRTKGVSDFDNGPWGYSGNPFGDDECGKFYGRSLSVWSALLALQGFLYDGPAGVIGFRPRMNEEDHASFFSTAEGYGLFRQSIDSGKLKASIEIAEGDLKISEIVLGDQVQPQSISVSKGDVALEASFAEKENDVRVKLAETVELTQGDRVEIELM